MAKSIQRIENIQLGTASSLTRYGDKEDSLLITLPKTAKVSCQFTNNKLKAAPVKLAIEHLSHSSNGEKAFLINAGNANAATGSQGMRDVKFYCKEMASNLNLKKENIIPFSTGVIGEAFPVNNYLNAFREAKSKLSGKNWLKAANAILTTDTKPKIISKQVKIEKEIYSITGFAKGSGMIRPDFATLLSFVFVDAKVNQRSLNKIHADALNVSFNAITVDGDTSPNDSSVLVVNGNENKSIKPNSKTEKKLAHYIKEIFKELAELLIEDAEGATKKIRISVSKAKNLTQAKSVAFTIAESPLVKTAMFGSDANWGRILSAVGRDRTIETIDDVQISVNGVPLVKKGSIDSKYSEAKATKAMKKREINVQVVLYSGKAEFEVLTSDLSEDYVLINSDYRS